MYKISWLERKTTVSGKEKADVTLEDDAPTVMGLPKVVVNNVTIWSDFPGFAELAPGHTVEGTLRPASDPKYGPTLYPIKKPVVLGRPSFMGGGAGKTAAIEKMAERKEESIKTFQGNKEFGIKVASTMRDVTLITLAMVGNIEDDKMATFAETFERVKTWYLEQWGKTERLLDVPF